MRLKLRLLLVSIVPPRNDCGVRIVLHRHLVERNPFDLHVASNADFADGLLIHTQLRLPRPIHRLRKSRFGPRLATWITDYENLICPLTANKSVGRRSTTFQTAYDSYASRMWVVSHRPKNSPTTRLAAGGTLPRLVPNDEGALRSQIYTGNFESALSQALRRM